MRIGPHAGGPIRSGATGTWEAYGAPVPPLIGPPSSPPMFWPVLPFALVDEFPGSQPSLPLPRPALQCFFAGGGYGGGQ